jgi:hypothetical protein
MKLVTSTAIHLPKACVYIGKWEGTVRQLIISHWLPHAAAAKLGQKFSLPVFHQIFTILRNVLKKSYILMKYTFSVTCKYFLYDRLFLENQLR